MPSHPRDDATAAFIDPVSSMGQGGKPDLPETFSFLEPPVEPDELGRLAQYRVLRVLGEGGMGYVFEAEDTHLARRVALKVMRPEYASDADYRQRFLVEARAAAALHSDYIVTVYQIGLAGDVPFQAIQLLNGESLQDRLERSGPLPVGLACIILRQVAEGLAVAHDHGLIHRDIKPANIWLESAARPAKATPEATESASADTKSPRAFSRAKILDFGLARSDSRDTKLTATGTIVGTPHYMSPEQASGLNLDGRSDLFSLGCVAYSMLTAEMAFEGSTTMAVLMALANRTPPPLYEKNPEVPQKLSELVSALLAKDPALRPASAHDLCEQLDEILVTIPNAYQDVAVGSGIRRRPASGGISATPSTSVSGPKTANVPAANPPSSVTADTTPTSRRWWPLGLATFIGAAGILGLFLLVGNLTKPTTSPEPEIPVPVASEPIRIGVLHSLSGTMALSEAPVVDAVLMAIDEVNAAGGVLGQPLEAHVIDGASDPGKFASAAEELYGQRNVSTIFGCWTSASRKAVRPIAERHNALLVYPVQYEGLEQSPHIVYLGPAPNQQIPLALDYVVKQLGKKRIFLIGSDYIYPRAAHEIIKDELKAHYPGQASIIGESYVPLGSKAVEEAITQIEKAKPDVILNTVNGTTNFHLFRAMHQKPSVEQIPVLSFSMSESDLRTLDPKMIAGDYLCGMYFEDIGHPEAAAFLKRFRERYGDEKRYSDPILSAYCGVHLWAQAANTSKSLQATAVTKAFREVSFDAPIGTVRIEPASLHAWLPGRIGRIKNDGNIEVVSQSEGFLRPEPFPASRSRAEWDLFLNDLFLDWDGHWQAPTR